MVRPIHQPSALEFRHGSTDRYVITHVEQAQTYGLVTTWARVIGADEKPVYRIAFPDGEIENDLKPRDALMLLSGLITAHRLHTKGLVVDIAKRGN